MARKDYYQISGLNRKAMDKEIKQVYEALSALERQLSQAYVKRGDRTALSSEPRYVISIAARMVGIEAHALRYYEKLGLIQPQRSKGKIRLYSEDDINQLRCIKTLMGDFGVNLAGMEVALHLMRRMEEMEHQVKEMEAKVFKLKEATTDDIE